MGENTNLTMAMRKSMKKAMKAMKKRSMKKSMKKSMRKRRAMKVSKIAKGKRARVSVFLGNKEKTKTGLKKSDLIKSKSGKIVSKKASANGKKAYKRISGWTNAVNKARKQLNIKGFQAVGGKSAKGQALLKKARSIYRK